MKNNNKFIKSLINLSLLMLFAFAFCATETSAQIKLKKNVDLSSRSALYFGNAGTFLSSNPINKDSKYVAAGKKIVLTPADAKESTADVNGKYSFTVMYVLYGSPIEQALALDNFTNTLKVGETILSQHSPTFKKTDDDSNSTKIHYVITTITLPVGESKITLDLDINNTVKESNEKNNTHTFTVEVLAKP